MDHHHSLKDRLQRSKALLSKRQPSALPLSNQSADTRSSFVTPVEVDRQQQATDLLTRARALQQQKQGVSSGSGLSERSAAQPKMSKAEAHAILAKTQNGKHRTHGLTSGSSVDQRQNVFQRCETIENDIKPLSNTGSQRWLLPYADMLTLLFAVTLLIVGMLSLDKSSLSVELNGLNADLNQALVAVEAEQSKQESLTQQLQLLSVELNQAEQRKAKQALEQDKWDTQQAKLVALKAAATAEGVRVHTEAHDLVISLADNVLFGPGQASISPAAYQTLDRLADVLKQSPNAIRIEGHTDTSPIQTSAYPSNWELSTARATTILRYLLEKHAFQPNQLSAAGYGQYRPVADNSTSQGKQKNRRVDIVIMGG